MSIADKLTLLASTKEAQRVALQLSPSTAFSKYVDYFKWYGEPIPQAKIVADFENNRYLANGEPSSFDELFGFSRASSAWLIKPDGVHEFLPDVPRFNDGLLIEESSANIILHSGRSGNMFIGTDDSATVSYSTEKVLAPFTSTLKVLPKILGNDVSVAYIYDSTTGLPTSGSEVSDSFLLYADELLMKEIATVANSGSTIIKNVNTGALSSQSDKNLSVSYKKIGIWHKLSVASTKAGASALFLISADPKSKSVVMPFYITCQQREAGYPSSYIPTGASTVSRSDEYLYNLTETTGTTITGDWDKTLSLSIVGGYIEHTGYGTIRRLEIN